MYIGHVFVFWVMSCHVMSCRVVSCRVDVVHVDFWWFIYHTVWETNKSNRHGAEGRRGHKQGCGEWNEEVDGKRCRENISHIVITRCAWRLTINTAGWGSAWRRLRQIDCDIWHWKTNAQTNWVFKQLQRIGSQVQKCCLLCIVFCVRTFRFQTRLKNFRHV